MPRRSRKSEEANIFEKGEFALDFSALAKDSIEAFFRDKNCSVPESELYSELSLKTLRTNFDFRWQQFVHRELEKLPPDPRYTDDSVPWSIHYLLKLLEEMRSKWISQDFQPGMVLLYLKFCKGVEIPPPPLL